jgi:hypothetical protein
LRIAPGFVLSVMSKSGQGTGCKTSPPGGVGAQLYNLEDAESGAKWTRIDSPLSHQPEISN